MGQYLDKFKDKIRGRQTQQILKLLTQQRNKGQIRSIEDFTQRLQNLVETVTSANLIPTFTLYQGQENDYIDSETYNHMLERVQDDLESGFEEANNIDEIQNAHETIVRDVLFKNLHSAIAELETKITLYEFLNKDKNGFSDAISSTFRETKENRLTRSLITDNSVLFIDPRTGLQFSETEDSSIELIGERLTLSATNNTYHTITSVRQIFDNETKQSELIVEPSNNKLSNMLDGQQGTYWIQSLLYVNNPISVNTKLEFDLGIVKEINFIEIEPILKKSILLTKISYLTDNNVYVDLNIPESELLTSASFRFSKIATNKFILTFKNINSIPTEFTFSNKEKLIDQAVNEPVEGYVPSAENINTDLDKLLSSNTVKTIINLPANIEEEFHGYEFLIGFDNIRTGLSNYSDQSVYVSNPLKICDTGILGLQTVESRPYTDVPTSDIKYTTDTYDNDTVNENGGNNSRNFLGSIEYWIIKQDYKEEQLIKTSVFPILPMNVQRVHHERLILNEKSDNALSQYDIGTLVHFTNLTDGDLKVYRNFTLLTNETGNDLATDGWKIYPEPNQDIPLKTPNNGSRMRFTIQIVNPVSTDLYTVTYTPLMSTTKTLPQTISTLNSYGGLQIVDLVGDLSARSLDNQMVIFDNFDSNQVLDSHVHLVIIFRQNTANSAITPYVEEYTLYAGCKDDEKFEEV